MGDVSLPRPPPQASLAGEGVFSAIFGYNLRSGKSFWCSEYIICACRDEYVTFNQQNRLVSSIIRPYIQKFPLPTEIPCRERLNVELHQSFLKSKD